MASHTFSFTLSATQIWVLAALAGFCIGVPAGVGAFQFGVSLGQASPSKSTKLEAFKVGDHYCIDGHAYKRRASNTDSVWNGLLEPLKQPLPPIFSDKGELIAEGAIPVSCSTK